MNPIAPRHPFPRSARVLTPAQFQRVFAEGRRFGGRCFSLHVLPHPPGSAFGSRLGLAVSRKVSARAVQRNRIKRVARDSFRRVRPALPSVDVVLVARREAADADNAVLRDELTALWRRVSALKPDVPAGTMPAAAPEAVVASPPFRRDRAL